jgi:hypothetical protein
MKIIEISGTREGISERNIELETNCRKENITDL